MTSVGVTSACLDELVDYSMWCLSRYPDCPRVGFRPPAPPTCPERCLQLRDDIRAACRYAERIVPTDESIEEWWRAMLVCRELRSMYQILCPFRECPTMAPPGGMPRDPRFDPKKDYCGSFVDVPDINEDVKYCCFLHDECYKKGGSEGDRMRCDRSFADCIEEALGFPVGDVVSGIYFFWVRYLGHFVFNYK
jgi:hypothetical protein